MTMSPALQSLLDRSFDEAASLRHVYVGVEHLHLALSKELSECQERHEGARKLLANLGVLPETIQRRIDEIMDRAAKSMTIAPSYSKHVDHFTHSDAEYAEDATKAIERAQEEAGRLGRDSIGSEQILLGLLRTDGDIAFKALLTAGLNIDNAREIVLDIVGIGDGLSRAYYLTPRANQVLQLAEDEAKRLGHKFINSGHLLLGLLGTNPGVAGLIFDNLGVNRKQLRADTLRLLCQ